MGTLARIQREKVESQWILWEKADRQWMQAKEDQWVRVDLLWVRVDLSLDLLVDLLWVQVDLSMALLVELQVDLSSTLDLLWVVDLLVDLRQGTSSNLCFKV